MWRIYYAIKYRLIHSYHFRIRKNKCLLEQELQEKGLSKWLDIGSSINHTNKNFYFADLYSVEECLPEMADKYFQFNISEPISSEDINKLGKYDFIRMQHVFEHFTYEQADIVLQNCHKLLNTNGKLLISVPDLDIYIKRYLNRTIREIPSFGPWARKRIEVNAPDSDYFSIFSHSLLHQKHLWCYNKIGLIKKLYNSGHFRNIERIGLFHKFAGIPFTHNRCQEDLCVIATKNN